MVKRSAKSLLVATQTPIDRFLRGALDLSWGKARALVESGKVFVDGVRVLDAAADVRAGQAVEVRESAPRPTAAMPSDLIAFVDAHVVVVRKPAGISTIPFDENEKGTLDELVKKKLGVRSLGIVHRIDKETSGLVVFTKTWLAKQSLSAQFRSHTVERKYLAIAHGDVKKEKIVSHLVADRSDGLRGSLERMTNPKGRDKNRDGQVAITHVEPLEHFREGDARATLVACTLETGRTHQIRIHLAERGHPILGERVYVRDFRDPQIPAPRVMLHAALLGFVHPKTEQHVKWEEDPPEDFLGVLRRLRGR
jgi:23S rRNA pseudouridine1911/1915/1917 synthase